MNTLRKPIVGLTPLWDKEKCVLKPMQETYLEAVQTAGGEPRVLDVADEDSAREELASCDALISTGGGDIAPELYGEARIESCGSSCPARDTFELITFRIALERGMPILGICRGRGAFAPFRCSRAHIPRLQGGQGDTALRLGRRGDVQGQ